MGGAGHVCRGKRGLVSLQSNQKSNHGGWWVIIKGEMTNRSGIDFLSKRDSQSNRRKNRELTSGQMVSDAFHGFLYPVTEATELF
jgi:hypothetical protein